MNTALKYFFLLFIIVSPSVVKGQNDIYIAVDQMPMPKEGHAVFGENILDKVFYPQDAIEKKVSGYVFVRFVVEKNGKINSVSIVRGIHPQCDAEVLRVFSNLPPWHPGTHEGQKVRVQVTLPIIFKL